MKHVVQIVMLAAGLCIFVGIVPSGEAFAEAQKEKEKVKGLIAFDFPKALEAKVEVNLSGKLISLVAKAAKPNPEVTELLNMLKGVYVRVYENDTTTFNELTRHYEDKLEKEEMGGHRQNQRGGRDRSGTYIARRRYHIWAFRYGCRRDRSDPREYRW